MMMYIVVAVVDEYEKECVHIQFFCSSHFKSKKGKKKFVTSAINLPTERENYKVVQQTMREKEPFLSFQFVPNKMHKNTKSQAVYR